MEPYLQIWRHSKMTLQDIEALQLSSRENRVNEYEITVCVWNEDTLLHRL